jgi:hypothetical protein
VSAPADELAGLTCLIVGRASAREVEIENTATVAEAEQARRDEGGRRKSLAIFLEIHMLLSRENFLQPAANDFVLVSAHHPDGDQQLSLTGALHMNRRVAGLQFFSDLLRGEILL